MSEFRRRLLRRTTVSAFLQGRGFQPVEYLSGADNPYIRTDVYIASDDFEVEMTASINISTTQQSIVGAWSNNRFNIMFSNSLFRAYLGTSMIGGSHRLSNNEVCHIRVFAQNGTAHMYRNGVLFASGSYNDTMVTSSPVCLFRTRFSYDGPYRIYEAIFRAGGRKTNHFFPCRRMSDNAPGLYDIVGDVFYQNQPNSGAFAAGPDVEINESI